MDHDRTLVLLHGWNQVEIPFVEWPAFRPVLLARLAAYEERGMTDQVTAHTEVLRKHDEVWAAHPDKHATGEIMAPKVGSGFIFSRQRTFTVIDAGTTL